ncbi:NAD(P)-binding domain-containing protein [Brachybacterium sp. ACRRE]|uniref:NAD(P)-binding domain-containing protein n=1 Tax=Brachybacterium sp. ACRRE TaxID=2918184 RepID=UPI001EF2EA4C|nr:NAD(P)-binding domain-containing protein [Brachybacterium sp. ACRRE]MCG7311276.1 NAD(P)-binding domain-containing protein [Brachybacterium sp. ACRRE]
MHDASTQPARSADLLGIETLGVIGVGEIAEAIVEGLLTIEEGPLATMPVVLSPRSASRSSALAARSSRVRVASTNQEVADASSALLLTLPAASVDEALTALRIPRDALVISAVAGISIAALRERIGEGPTIVRTIPMPAVRRRAGSTPLHPDDPRARTLFDGLGGVVLPPDEDAFSAFSVVSSSVSTHVEYLATLAAWLGERGVPAHDAESLIRGIYLGVAGALADADTSLPALRRAHETPGGLNEQLRETWLDSRNTASLHAALDALLERARAR